ncbi:MAG: DNA alkylation repair protein [Prolixibacteraceae bacterium]|nr:DNA alkylation repair protein [Prolixibacteraceae bacterium]
MNELISQTLQKLRALSDPSSQEFLKKMVPSQKEVLGIKTMFLREVLKELRQDITRLSFREKIDLSIGLIHTNVLEMAQLGYELVGKDKKVFAALTADDLAQMNYQLDNWVSVDTFGVYIHGKAWRTGLISDEHLMKMVHHEDFWQRRLAVVSTIPLNQKSNGGKGDSSRTFMICNEVVSDDADMVVKALSWALRELSKREPMLVHEFMEMNKAKLHNRVRREVSNKLTTGKKNPST